MRSVHATAPDGGMRAAIGMPGLRGASPPGDPDRALLLDIVVAIAAGACQERAQRARATHAVVAERFPWRRLCLLFASVIPLGEAWKGRIENLSHEPTVDAIPLESDLR